MLHFGSKLALTIIIRQVWLFGENVCIRKCPASKFEARASTPLPKGKIKRNERYLFPSEGYKVCGVEAVLTHAVSSFLFLLFFCSRWQLPLAPRRHSCCKQALLLPQLCRLMSLRTSQLAGIVRSGTLSNTSSRTGAALR